MNKLKYCFRIVTMVITTVVMMLSCSKSETENPPFGLVGNSEVRLSVGLDKTENEQSIGGDTKAVVGAPVLDPRKDLAVYVINTHEDTLARWACFDDMPASLKFIPGAYKIVAEYKPVEAKIPSFDTYIYRGENKFVIKPKDELTINLVAKLATAKISVEFDPSFDFHYVVYSVDIRTVGVDYLQYVKTEKRSGFFEPGSVRMRFNLVTQDGEVLTWSPPPLMKADSADYYKLTLKVDSDQGGAQVIVIGTSDGLNDQKDITIEVPKYFLPKDKPTVTATDGFVSGEKQVLFEGEKNVNSDWHMAAEVPGGLSSFVIRFNEGSTNFPGGHNVFDLASLSENDPRRDALKAAGFVWSPELNSPEDAAICSNPWVDFFDVMRAQTDGTAAQYNFQFEITDNYDQTPELNNPCVVLAEIKSPTVTFAEIVTANLWATKAEFTIKTNYDLMTGVPPVLQYRRKASGGTWHDALKDNLNVTSKSKEGDLFVAGYELRGLDAETEYEFRAVSNDKIISPVGEETGSKGWITEKKLDVPGLVDGSFEDGWNPEAATTGLGVKVEAPTAVSGWATRNALSTAQKELSVNSSTGSGTMAVSEVSANNGTRLIPNPASMRRKAVELRTTGWGQGTYSNSNTQDPGEIYLAGPSGRPGSPIINSRVRNVSAGVLYLGTYSFNSASLSTGQDPYTWYKYNGDWIFGTKVKKTVTQYPYESYNGGESISESGADFASRPNSLKFNYNFTPVVDGGKCLVRAELYAADNSDDPIATASLTDAAVTGENEMKSANIVFTYSNSLKKATTIKILFSSDSNLNVATPSGGAAYNTTTNGTTHVGNVLLIDEVELGYDF